MIINPKGGKNNLTNYHDTSFLQQVCCKPFGKDHSRSYQKFSKLKIRRGNNNSKTHTLLPGTPLY